MIKIKNKAIVATMITMFLLLTVVVAFNDFSTTKAHYPPWTIPTFAFVTASPSPVGVGQNVLILMWLDKTSPDMLNYEWGEFFTGFKLNITAPDGTTEILGPYTADPASSTFTTYTPTQAGTYKIVFSWPGQTIHGTNLWPGFDLPGYGPLYPSQIGRDPNYINDTFAGSTSAPFYLTVQQEPIKAYPDNPLPTDYWTTPINAQNRGWEKVSGNWLSGAAQNVNSTVGFAYGQGPESAHILWTKPMWSGGIVGGEQYGALPITNRLDSSNLNPPIILNGKLYYNLNRARPYTGWVCVDLYSGETQYFKNASSVTTSYFTTPIVGNQSGNIVQNITSVTKGFLAFGSVLSFYDPDWSGQIPYLWVTATGIVNQWDVIDAYSGERVFSIANVSSAGTQVYGSRGDIDYYNIVNYGSTSAPKYYLTMWNSTQATARWRQGLWMPITPSSFAGETVDGRNGFSMNVSIPAVQGTIKAVRERQYVIGGTLGNNFNGTITLGNLWALSLKPGEEGKLLWNITYTPPENVQDTKKFAGTGPYNPGISGYGDVGAGGSFVASDWSVDPEDDVFVMSQPLIQTRYGFSLKTGELLWTSEPESPMQYYSMQTRIYQGMLFSTGFGGQIIAYNITTGAVLWNYNATGVGFEFPYGWGRAPVMPPIFADGKLYVFTCEHSPTMPLERGAYMRCINASNGSEIWKQQYYGGSYNGGSLSISNGYLIALNMYDWQIYCVGKGPSSTEVSASPEISAQGDSVMIKGMVTDKSPGAISVGPKFGFTNGVPAMSDESMGPWMEYLYQQQPKPTDATGVEVSLDTIDPNNNYVHIGNATSDMNGFFSYMWTPEIPGKYTVIATFPGSSSYGSSYAETSIGVGTVSTASPVPPESQQSAADMYFVPAVAGIIAAIVIGFAINAILLLKKRA